jgi:hypothetical protein
MCRGWHEPGDLLAILDRLEHRAHRDLERLPQSIRRAQRPPAAEHPGQPPRPAVALGDRHDPSVVGQPAAHVGDHAGGVAAIGRISEAMIPNEPGSPRPFGSIAALCRRPPAACRSP